MWPAWCSEASCVYGVPSKVVGAPDSSAPTPRHFLTPLPTDRYTSSRPTPRLLAIDFLRRAISPGEGPPRARVARAQKIIRLHPLFPSLLLSFSGGGLVDPLVRASDEHILIVRVPRAGGRPGCPLFFLAGPSPHPMPVQISPHRPPLSPFF